MRDPFNLEPKDGDFASYVENLQKDEIEKLRRANPTTAAEAAHNARSGDDALSLRDLIKRSKEVFGNAKKDAGITTEVPYDNIPEEQTERTGRRSCRKTDEAEMTDEEFDAMVERELNASGSLPPRKTQAAGPMLTLIAVLLFIGVIEGYLPEPVLGFALVLGFAGIIKNVQNGRRKK